jgi:DNA mismatch endonuclease (patch repair protein)
MRANRRRDTGPELAVRRLLHAAGQRYRVDFAIRPGAGRQVRPDIVFPARNIAVFIDGCFWHGCPVHATRPATNRAYWEDKIATNQARDAATTAALQANGWTVLRFWEHENPVEVAARIADLARACVSHRPRHSRSDGAAL